MIRYKVYYRKIKQVCEVILRDNEKRKVVLEYIDRTTSNPPYKEVKKRIEVEMNSDLRTVRFTERYDRFDNPIYDGDVIKEHDLRSGKCWLGLIRWDKEKGQFMEIITQTPFTSLKLPLVENLGSIWDNPELIKLLPHQGNN